MSLYKRDGVWWIDVWAGPQGRRRRIRRSARTRDRKKAQAVHDHIQSEAFRQGQLGQRPRHTWREAVVSYMTGREGRASYDQDIQRLKWLDPHLGDLALEDITASVLEDAKQARLQEAAPSTVNRLLVLVRAVLNHAVDREWLDKAPKVKPAAESPRRVEWLTPAEADALLGHLPKHLQAFVSFALCTGLRMRNITRLEWSQIDMQRRCAWIHGDQSKSGRPIAIPLTRKAIEVLRSQMGRHATRVFTVGTKTIRPYDRVNQRTLQRAADAAGIQKRVHPHLFRHTWASWHIMGGTSLAELQALGGWSKLESVMIYAHMSAEHLRKAAEQTRIGHSWMETPAAPEPGPRK